nr:hypothetical protein [Tanacetum cinerariifolium]
MATTIEQQVVIDDALVPSTQRDMLHISPRIPDQSFDELPLEEEIIEFIRNIDYAFLIWEDFVYQVAHKNHKKGNEMYYPRFIKVIIHYFMSKDPSIPRRNKVNWYYVRDDILFSMIKVVSRHQNTQQYGAMLPIELINDEIKNTKAYKEYYAFATGEAVPKPKASTRRKRSDSDTSITPPTVTPSPKPTAATTLRLTAAAKGKQPAKATKAKSPSALSEVAMTKVEQLKLVLKRSRQQMHISQFGGSGTNKGTSSKPGVPDVPTDESEEELAWNSSDDEGADDQGKDGDDDEENQEVAKFDEKDDAEGGGDDDKESESDEEDDNKETRDEETFDPIPKTLKSSEDEGDGEEDQGLNVHKEEHVEEEEEDELNRDVNINQGRGLQENLEVKDSHVTLTLVKPDGQKIKEQVKGRVKEQVSKILPRIEQSVNAQLEAEVLTRSSHSLRTSYVVAADLLEMELKKILIEKMEGNKSIQRSDDQRNLYKALVDAYEADKVILDSYGETVILKRRRDDDDDDKDEGPSAGLDRGSKRRREEEPVQTTSHIKEPSHQSQKPPSLDRDWNKTLPAIQGITQTWISELAKQADSRSSFNKLLDTQLDFSNFIMNRLRVDTLTLKLLAGPTYELIKGSCTSLIELEYHLEEVYKVTTDQLDWVNPEGQLYPHNLLQPLSLIPDNRGRCVIPFAHFINNDLEYLRGVDYDKHALWGVSHRGHKRQQFYGFTVNRESALNVYSKRRIIAVTDLKIVEWHSYKHLDWISVRRDDDKIYKFKEGNFKRLRLQDIEDMLLLLVQGKLPNLIVEERFAFNKRLNLTKPDTYRSDLKRREAYTAYSNPRGFIYQNKDKKNRLIRIDELYKFSDETLNDVRTALDGRLKGIRMQYLPQTI